MWVLQRKGASYQGGVLSTQTSLVDAFQIMKSLIPIVGNNRIAKVLAPVPLLEPIPVIEPPYANQEASKIAPHQTYVIKRANASFPKDYEAMDIAMWAQPRTASVPRPANKKSGVSRKTKRAKPKRQSHK